MSSGGWFRWRLGGQRLNLSDDDCDASMAMEPTRPTGVMEVESVQTSKDICETRCSCGNRPAAWATLSALLLSGFLASIAGGWRILSRAEPLDDPAISKAQSAAVSALGLVSFLACWFPTTYARQ